uniref:Uncharacterized protein n=1 Tax=Rhizophora mucronata TaxID=61149 RepID=A0A2P2QG03_RHIMU
MSMSEMTSLQLVCDLAAILASIDYIC